MKKTDRRVQRTRELLQKALVELMGERGYGDITIQEIVTRANVGRTTFYSHYKSKNALFMSCHEAVVSEFHVGPHQLSKEEWLSPETPPGMIVAYRHLLDERVLLSPIFKGEESLPLLRRIRERSAQDIAASLRAAFPKTRSTIPIDVLANYLAGAQTALVQWWLEKHQRYTPEELAQTVHRVQRAAIREAFGLIDSE
jgi:AcrR family transcriptional regulator